MDKKNILGESRTRQLRNFAKINKKNQLTNGKYQHILQLIKAINRWTRGVSKDIYFQRAAGGGKAVVRVFTEWTCEGSLKLQSRSRRWRDARPLPRRCVCQYAVERSAKTGNKGGTAEVEFQELLSLYKWKIIRGQRLFLRATKRACTSEKESFLCSHKEWFFTGRISSLHTTEMQRKRNWGV